MTNSAALRTDADIIQHLERLRADFTTLSETVKKIASDSAAGARSQASEAADTASRAASAAGQQIYKDVEHLGRDALNTATAATDRVENYIARNSLPAVVAALCIGFSIGLLSRRQ